MTTSVFLIEDDLDLGAALNEYLQLSGFSVRWARSGIEFYAALAEDPDFQVAIVDIGLPDQSGLVLADYIRRNSHAGVIVLTANDSPERSVASYRLGVDVFMAKPIDNEVLVAAITSIGLRYQQRQNAPPQPMPSDQASVSAPAFADKSAPSQTTGGWRLDQQRRHLIAPQARVIQLTRQELTICEMLASSSDRRVARADTLRRLYQRDDESAQRSLDTLVSRLRRKISHETGQAAPILTDYGVGHCFTEPLILSSS